MSILDSLDELRADSQKRLHHVTRGYGAELMVLRNAPSGHGQVFVVRSGVESLKSPAGRRSHRRVKTLEAARGDNYTHLLNTALLGGENYPVLTFVLGAAGGVASSVAGLLFRVVTTALSVQHTNPRALARTGDELWQVEEIGKVRSGSAFEAVHVNAFFLVDPYRSRATTARTKGWLLHEERHTLTLV